MVALAMFLSCPKCASRYAISDAQLGPAGRKVRCSDCGHVWFQEPVTEEARPSETQPDQKPVKQAAKQKAAATPEPETEPTPEAAFDADEADEAEAPMTRFDPFADETAGASPDASAETAWPEEPETVIAAAHDDEERPRIPRLPRLPAEKRPSRAGRLGWILLLLLVAGLAGGLFFGRNAIVTAWPPAALLYEKIGYPAPVPGEGLLIRNIRVERLLEGSTIILVVQGEVVNLSDLPAPIPPLRAMLRDLHRKDLQEWVFEASRPALAPGEMTPFRTEFVNPAGEAADLVVTFDPMTPS